MAIDSSSLRRLADLLKTEEDADADEEEQLGSASMYQSPASIGQSSNQKYRQEDSKSPTKSRQKDSKEIWDNDEIVEDGFDGGDELDDRPSPEYEILFKQRVTTDDIFLGLSSKNQSTASCEDLLVRIQLPDTKKEEIDLDVKDTFLNCRSAKFRLALHLPHKVVSKNGKADWNESKATLTVTLPLNREYDFMNF